VPDVPLGPTSREPPATPWTRHLDSAAVTGVLARAKVVGAVHGVTEVGSTQDVALQLARDAAPSGTVVVADRQLHGRGRQGRRWDDAPDGGSLAMTVLLDVPPYGATLVALAVGLAVTDAAGRLSGAQDGRVALKWPNDVVVRGGSGSEDTTLRKLAGILVQRENIASGDAAREEARDVLLVGIGLNVDHRALPPVADRICLAALHSVQPARDSILAGLLEAIDARLAQLLSDSERGPESVLRAYRAASDTLGRQVDIDLPDGRRFTGTASDVDAGGALVVEVDGQSEVVVTGTVRDHTAAIAGSAS